VAHVAATAFTPVTASGGTSPYTFAVSPALPAGLSFNTSTGQVTGTPSAASPSATYTVTVTDANGSTSSKTFTLSVGAGLSTAQAVASTSLVANVAATAFTPVTASGGTSPYTFAVSPALPAGLSLNTSTGQVTGTPTAGSPSATYTVTVTDANGSTSSKTFTLQVSEALVATTQVEVATLEIAAEAGPFTPVVASGGTLPYSFGVAPALPAGLSLNATTGQISGTPQQSTAMADYVVTITDSRGERVQRAFRMATQAVIRLDVQPRTLSVPSAGLPFRGQLSASGGTAPYQFALVAGSLPEGLALSNQGLVSGKALRAGTGSVTLQVTDANGAVATVVVSIEVGSRPDPSADAAVRGLLAAQQQTLLRFADAQLRNVMERLDGGTTECRAALEQRLHLAADWKDSRPAGQERAAAAGKDAEPDCRGVSAWVAGTVEHGRVSGAAADSPRRFSTPGLSVGLDSSRLLQGLRLGVALGQGQDRTEVGDQEGRLDARSRSLTLYAAWQPAPLWQLKAAVGTGRATLDLQRTVTGDKAVLNAERSARQHYAAVAGSLQLDLAGWRLRPQLMLKQQAVRLDSFTEQGDSPLALAQGSTRVRSQDWQAGLSVNRRWQLAGLWLEPVGRLEWQTRRQTTTDQGLQWADGLDDTRYIVAGSSSSSALATLSLGLRVLWPSGVSAAVDGRSSRGDGQSSHSWGLRLRWDH
jgi:uncharacterized protein with beta-barrel porin domain